MKRLLVSVFLLCSLNAVKAAPILIPPIRPGTFIQSRDGAHDTVMVPVLNACTGKSLSEQHL